MPDGSEPRTKAENADRLERMAAQAAIDPELTEAERDRLLDELDGCQTERDTLADLLNSAESARQQAVAECERLKRLTRESADSDAREQRERAEGWDDEWIRHATDLHDAVTRQAAELAELAAERDRLRVIVDLAIAVTHPQTREQWRKAQLPFVQAVEAEVERRG